MSTVGELDKAYEEICRLARNFRKDSEQRKTQQYIYGRIEALQRSWYTFHIIADRLRKENIDCRTIQESADQVHNTIIKELRQRQKKFQENNDQKEDPTIADADETGKLEEHQEDKLSKSNMSSISLSEALRLTPEFDGTAGELHRFLNACETALQLIAEENKDAYHQIVKLKLKGRAYETVKYNEYTSFDDLKKMLKTQFLETKTLETLQTELMSIRQKANETESEYGNRAEHLLMDLNTACCPDNVNSTASEAVRKLNTRTALRAFQEGLREPLRLLIKASRYDTLKDTIEAAIAEGKIFEERSKQHQHTQRYNQNFTQNKPNYTRTQNQNFTRGSNPKFCNHCRKNGHNSEECYSKLKCNKCNRIGHTTNQCRVTGTNPNPFRIQEMRMFCNYCKKSGHTYNHCLQRTGGPISEN